MNNAKTNLPVLRRQYQYIPMDTGENVYIWV